MVDTTGDADLIARTHASFESDIDEGDIHHCINTAFLFGGVDMERWLAFRRDDPEGFSEFMAHGRAKLKFFEKPFVSWRNDVALFMGPRLSGYSAVDVEDLTTVELRSRQLAVGHLEVYRASAPGFAERVPDARRARRSACATAAASTASTRSLRQQWDTGTSGTTRSACRPRCRPSSPTSPCPMAR